MMSACSRSDRSLIDTRFIDETMEFAVRMTRVKALAFYVINQDQDSCNFRRLGVPESFHREYKAGMCRYDPFEYHRLDRPRQSATLLTDAISPIPTPEDCHYVRFIRAHGYEDAVEVVFQGGTRVLGGMSLLLDQGDDPSQVAAVMGAMSPYIEYNLRGFTGRSRTEVREDLMNEFALSPRELDVVELLASGRTNGSIAEALHISIATVKSHVLKIYEKVGVPNRASLVSLMSEYEAH